MLRLLSVSQHKVSFYEETETNPIMPNSVVIKFSVLHNKDTIKIKKMGHGPVLQIRLGVTFWENLIFILLGAP